jgi:poly-gamma-glutamate synthesis protein (capsule biosynthesis protein)
VGGQHKQILLHPIDLGFGNPRAQRGRPVLAKGQTADEILDRLDKLCQSYNVRVKNIGGTGVIAV